MASLAGHDVGGLGAGSGDPSELPQAAHVPVSRLTIGAWNLVAKSDEHVLLSFYWAERKLVWEVLHLSVVRKMELDFEDVVKMELSTPHPDEPERLVVELGRPPRFYKEQASLAVGGKTSTNYVYTTDFTNGQASSVSRHILHFAPGALSAHAPAIKEIGLPLSTDRRAASGDGSGGAASAGRAGGAHAASAALRQPPTSSPRCAPRRPPQPLPSPCPGPPPSRPPSCSPPPRPSARRLDAIILQEQLDREMGDRQARYTGICPVREQVYAMAFDELLTSVGKGLPKRGSLLDRVRAEARLSIDAYRTAFESSIAFGNRKLTAAVELKGDLEEVMAELDEEIAARATEVAHLTHVCESLEHRAKKKEEGYAEDDREITELMQEKNQLEDLLKVLKASKPEKKEGEK